MNKTFASAAMAAAVLVSQAFADKIAMNDGQTVENATVLKVGVREIEYKVGKRKVLYTVRKADVAKITYKDGSIDTFPLQEKRKGWKGDGFGKPNRWNCRGWGYGDEPGEFRERERFGERPEFDGPPPSGKPYGPRGDGPRRPRDGKAIGQPGERYQNDNSPLPPPPQEAGLTPPPPPPPQPAAQPAPPPPPPAKTQAAPAQPPAPQPPVKTQSAPPPPTQAQPAPAQPPAPPQPVKTQSAPPPQPAPATPAK